MKVRLWQCVVGIFLMALLLAATRALPWQANGVLALLLTLLIAAVTAWEDKAQDIRDRRPQILEVVLALLVAIVVSFGVLPGMSRDRGWNLGPDEHAFPFLIFLTYPLLKVPFILWWMRSRKAEAGFPLIYRMLNITYASLAVLEALAIVSASVF